MLTEGWSIHELGTARMGTDQKTSVLNQFQQSHDVKNLFVVDGSSHVSASCQNPTWTIMALAWRSCDYLVCRVQEGKPLMDDLSRRDVIKLGAAATVAASLGVADVARARRRPSTFFTPDELTLVDELSEMIIPTDDHSPGARAAKVAAYIDTRLAEAWDEKDKTTWRDGLDADRSAVAGDQAARPFMQSSPAERTAVLTRMAQNERNPQKPEELFFAELKSRVVHAYYTSEIGIKQEMDYKGNTYLAEFVGTDVS